MAVFGGPTKVKPYAIITLDASVARSATAQGAITILGETVEEWIANTITVLDLAGNTLTFNLDDPLAGDIPASDGLKEEGIPFSEIYWTNAGGAGDIIIQIAWVD
jgi:hypothetical protein